MQVHPAGRQGCIDHNGRFRRWRDDHASHHRYVTLCETLTARSLSILLLLLVLVTWRHETAEFTQTSLGQQAERRARCFVLFSTGQAFDLAGPETFPVVMAATSAIGAVIFLTLMKVA